MPYLSNCSQVRRNVTDVAYHIAQYTNIISELREEIMVLRSKIQDQGPRSHANIQAVQCKDFNLSLTLKDASLCNSVSLPTFLTLIKYMRVCKDKFLCLLQKTTTTTKTCNAGVFSDTAQAYVFTF